MAWTKEARAAAALMRHRRKNGEPWRRQRLTATVHVSDPTRVGGTKAHNKILKTIHVRAVTHEMAKERIVRFYKKKGYTNINVGYIGPSTKKGK